MNFEYTPPKTLREFMLSEARVRAIRGPVGSGKTTACIMEMLRRATEQEPGYDGMRRTRFAIIRNTLPQIKTTCLVSIEQLLRPIMNLRVADNTVQIRFNDVISDWLMLPLDTEENVRRLLSLELTGAWVSEFREVEPTIVKSALSRVNRFPSRIMGGATWAGLVMETNSFSEDSPWYEELEMKLPSNWSYHVQPGARDPDAENLENLPPSYYQDQIEANANSPDWIDQYIDNKIGPSLSGQAVFAKVFKHGFHTAEQLNTDFTRPLVIGMDTGRNPAAAVLQLDARGRALCLGSCHGENMGIETFIAQELKPKLFEWFGALGKMFVSVDPAARQRSQIGEESVMEAIKRLGFHVVLAPTNQIAPRLRVVEKYMQLALDGKAGFLIDKRRNETLLRALMHSYRYTRNKEGELQEIPEKSHPWSDVADALQYALLALGSPIVGRALAGLEAPKPRKVAAGGWT
jgi:hypothetical protein